MSCVSERADGRASSPVTFRFQEVMDLEGTTIFSYDSRISAIAIAIVIKGKAVSIFMKMIRKRRYRVIQERVFLKLDHYKGQGFLHCALNVLKRSAKVNL